MNIYLIASESRILINEEINKIVLADANIVTIDYLESSVEEILEEASYFSLFNENKYVIVKNALFFGIDKISEKEIEMLEKYINNPNQNTILIFCLNGKLDERKKIVKNIKEKYKLLILKKLSNSELISRVEALFKNDDFKIDKDIAKYIAESALYNYDLVINEIEKIKLYYGKKSEIKYDDVVNLVSKNTQDNIFKFTEAVVKRDVKRSFELFEDLKLIKTEGVVILNALAREYRLMYKCQILANKGFNKDKISKELGLVDWLVNKVLTNSYNYNLQDLLEKLEELADLDIKFKSGEINIYLGLELFLLNI